MKNKKVKREAPMTMLEISKLSAEEKEQRLMNVRVALVSFHAVLKAAQHSANFIRYHQNMINKKGIKKILAAFVEQDYLIAMLDKDFESDVAMEDVYLEEQSEVSYKILEEIEEKCIDYIESEMGFRIVQEVIE